MSAQLPTSLATLCLAFLQFYLAYARMVLT